MFFTQEDYRKIENWLYQRTIKDTQFPEADTLNGSEKIPIIQDNKNKILTLNDFVKQVAHMQLPDFYNVTSNHKKPYITLEEAISLVPVGQRKLGLVITFHNERGNWVIHQFSGTSLNQWNSLNYWNNIIQQALEELLLFPDEEDITGVRDGNRTFLKFRNRSVDPSEFVGKGMIILRRNLVGTNACSLDDEDHMSNILTQEMINQEDTVYVVEYDFDLDGKVISIPKGCTLWFQGGTINNGSIYLQETAILGAFEFADMGNCKLFGKFNTGQIMTFFNDSYKRKVGGYFVATTKESSATEEEDGKKDVEVFYDINPDAYETSDRQELRWWNGEEWIWILDATDYNEIISIINDLINKHNAEMSACYKYFKKRIFNIEVAIENILEVIQNIWETINNLQEIINQIQEIINNLHGCESITVNGDTYYPDDNGNITLPDYPDGEGGTADRVANKLIFTGAVEAEYDGSEEVTVNIPEGGGGEAKPNELLTVKTQSGTTLGTYDGTEAVTITVPDGGGDTPVPVSNKTLTIKVSGDDEPLGTYNGSEDVTIVVPKGGGSGESPSELEDLLIQDSKGETKVTYNGSTPKTFKHEALSITANKATIEYDACSPKSVDIDSIVNNIVNNYFEENNILYDGKTINVLAAGYISRNPSNTAWSWTGRKADCIYSISASVSNTSTGAVAVKVQSASGYNVVCEGISVTQNKITKEGWQGPIVSEFSASGNMTSIYIIGYRKTSDTKQSFTHDGMTTTGDIAGAITRVNIIVLGTVTKTK